MACSAHLPTARAAGHAAAAGSARLAHVDEAPALEPVLALSSAGDLGQAGNYSTVLRRGSSSSWSRGARRLPSSSRSWSRGARRLPSSSPLLVEGSPEAPLELPAPGRGEPGGSPRAPAPGRGEPGGSPRAPRSWSLELSWSGLRPAVRAPRAGRGRSPVPGGCNRESRFRRNRRRRATRPSPATRGAP